MKSPSNKFFSLIELLLVMAVIGVAISLLQPSFKKVSDNARALLCLKNEMIIYSYIASYIDDNNNLYVPGTFHGGGGWNDQITYDDSISIYDGRNMQDRTSVRHYYPETAVGGEELYRCSEEELTGWDKQLRRSYTLNSNLADGWVGPTWYGHNEQTANQNDVPNLSKVILLTEVRSVSGHYAAKQNVMSGGQNGYYAYVRNAGMQSYGMWNVSDIWADPWHNGEWNYVFADGHSERLSPFETMSTQDIKIRNGNGLWTTDLND